MGRFYGEDKANYKSDPPRPDDDRILDDRTGNAAIDGYTAMGPRRPRSGMEMVDAEEADEMDRWDDDDSGMMPW